ncbi:hypothetical protein GGI06_000805, partial [Coemansia sp. S85]
RVHCRCFHSRSCQPQPLQLHVPHQLRQPRRSGRSRLLASHLAHNSLQQPHRPQCLASQLPLDTVGAVHNQCCALSSIREARGTGSGWPVHQELVDSPQERPQAQAQAQAL